MANARARDPLRPYVVLVMAERIGEVIGYAGYRTYDDDWNAGECWQYIGYPGELSSGERPAFQGDAVVSSEQDFSLNGNTGFVVGHFTEFTPGQSGGFALGLVGRGALGAVIPRWSSAARDLRGTRRRGVRLPR